MFASYFNWVSTYLSYLNLLNKRDYNVIIKIYIIDIIIKMNNIETFGK